MSRELRELVCGFWPLIVWTHDEPVSDVLGKMNLSRISVAVFRDLQGNDQKAREWILSASDDVRIAVVENDALVPTLMESRRSTMIVSIVIIQWSWKKPILDVLSSQIAWVVGPGYVPTIPVETQLQGFWTHGLRKPVPDEEFKDIIARLRPAPATVWRGLLSLGYRNSKKSSRSLGECVSDAVNAYLDQNHKLVFR